MAQAPLPIDFGNLKVSRYAVTKTACVCRGCGVTFWRKLSARNKGLYHSRACAFEHHAVGGNKRPVKPKPPKLVKYHPCVVCGKDTLPRRQTCSPECQREHHRRVAYAQWKTRQKPEREIVCRECGRGFRGRGDRRQFCSTFCCRRALHRIGKGIRRARLRQVEVEAIDPKLILRRDRYRCRLCGQSTPARLRGSTHDRAPEVDHIVPLALGGSHTYANTQCVCRACNMTKSARVRGQLRLALGETGRGRRSAAGGA